MMMSKNTVREVYRGLLIAVVLLSLIFASLPASASDDDSNNKEGGGHWLQDYPYVYLDAARTDVQNFLDALSDRGWSAAFGIGDDDVNNIYYYTTSWYSNYEYPHIDSVDIFYVDGDGVPLTLMLTDYQGDGNVDTSPFYGNAVDLNQLSLQVDLEWGIFAWCESLNISSPNDAPGLKDSIINGGAHSFLGFHSIMHSAKHYGQLLVEFSLDDHESIWDAWKDSVFYNTLSEDYDEVAIIYAYIVWVMPWQPISIGSPSPADILSGSVHTNSYTQIIDYSKENIGEPYADPFTPPIGSLTVYYMWEDV